MRSRNVILSLVLLVVLIAIAMVKWKYYDPERRELVNRRPARLQYAQFALCNMSCRNISRGEVEAILQSGVINLNQSNRRRFPCPTFALQGTTPDGRYLRILVEQCRNATMVLNCYDLRKEFSCDCDNDKNEKQI